MSCVATVPTFHYPTPSLRHPRNPHLVFRIAKNANEIAQANQLINRNYIEEGYWEGDEENVSSNKYLNSPMRHVIVFMNGNAVAGTASVILDSNLGLPADRFEPGALDNVRLGKERIAEISALAIDKSYRNARSMLMLLMRFIYHLSYHYLQVDRLVVVCNPKHIDFYETIVKFQRFGELKNYNYVNAPGQLLTLRLSTLDINYSFHRYLLEPLEKPQANAA